MSTPVSVAAVVLTAFFLAACTEAAEAPEERGETAARIIGGTPDGSDAAVVGLYVTDGTHGSICTGEVIAARFVLTASHCVDSRVLGFTPTRIAIVTAPDMYTVTADNVFNAKAATEFPTYNPSTGANDIAVVEVDTAMPVAPLPYNRTRLTPDVIGTPVRAIGYGVTTDGDTNTAGRKNVGALTMSSVLPTTFLAQSPSATQCHGDSGGPVLMPIDGVETIIGVGWQTVNTDGTCSAGVQDTRVDVYAVWIDAMVRAGAALSQAQALTR